MDVFEILVGGTKYYTVQNPNLFGTTEKEEKKNYTQKY